MAEEVVDINSATVKDLSTLFGVGRAKAEAIFSARMVKGTFSSLEELLSVPGIGRNVLDQNKELLVCEGAPENTDNGNTSSSQPMEENKQSTVTRESPSSRVSGASESASSGQARQTSPNGKCTQSRRSSRRYSQHQDPQTSSATTSSCSSSSSSSSTPATASAAAAAAAAAAATTAATTTTGCRISRTTPPSAKQLNAKPQLPLTSRSSIGTCVPVFGFPSNLATRTRLRLDGDYTGISLDGANKSGHDIPNVSEECPMDWFYLREAGESDNIDVNRIENCPMSTISNVNKPTKASSNSSTSNGYLIAGELGEADLNKLRVRENNYEDDNEDNIDITYKDDYSSVSGEVLDDSMHETSEEIVAALRRNHRDSGGVPGGVGPSAVLGSDTPYEDPPEQHCLQLCSLSPNAMDRLRPQGPLEGDDCLPEVVIAATRPPALVDDSIDVICEETPNSLSESSSNMSATGTILLHGGHSSHTQPPTRIKTTGDVSDVDNFGAGSSHDIDTIVVDNVVHEDAAMESSIYREFEKIEALEQSAESIFRGLEGDGSEDDLENNSDEELEDDDEDEKMMVELPVSHQDKKQVKRKYEVGGELRALLPVKKSCIAEAPCMSGNLCGSIGRRAAPTPCGLPSWLGQFGTWSQQDKITALNSLIDVCDLNQVRHVHQIILPTFQRDFISLLPKELALYVLTFLLPKDLLQAAQTCKYWNMLTADNLLWREKCKEAGIENFLDHMDKRRKRGTSVGSVSPYKTVFMRRHHIECNWRVNDLKDARILKGHDDHVITCLQFCGNTIVSGSDDNTLKVWNATTSKCVRTLTGHTGGVWSSQMRDNIIVSGSTDRMLRVWDAETGECTQTLYGHTSTVRCLHLHHNIVVSGSRDATLRVWDVSTGTCNHVLVGHVAAVRCVQYNGKLVVSGAYDFMVKVWNPVTEECLHTLQGHTNRVYSLQFDGAHVVSGSLDTTIRVWDVESGTCRHTLMGHQSLTSGMELHNNILISGNADSTVKVWDIVTGQCLQTLSGSNKHRSAVTCLQFINKFVVTSSDDGTVKLWDVSTGEFVRNLVTLDTGNSGGVVWRIRASDTKLVCAVGSRNGTEETKLMVLDFDVEES